MHTLSPFFRPSLAVLFVKFPSASLSSNYQHYPNVEKTAFLMNPVFSLYTPSKIDSYCSVSLPFSLKYCPADWTNRFSSPVNSYRFNPDKYIEVFPYPWLTSFLFLLNWKNSRTVNSYPIFCLLPFRSTSRPSFLCRRRERLPFLSRLTGPNRCDVSRHPYSLNDWDQSYNVGDDRQDMNDPTHRIASDQSKEPQHQKNHRYSPIHVRLLSDRMNRFVH